VRKGALSGIALIYEADVAEVQLILDLVIILNLVIILLLTQT